MSQDLGAVRGRIEIDGGDQAAGQLTRVKTAAQSLDGQGSQALSGLQAAGDRLKQLEDRADAFQAKYGGLAKGMVAGGLAIAGGLAFAAKGAMNFETAMANVNSIAGYTPAQLGAITEEINALSLASGKGPVELAEGLYDVVSSGFEGADAMTVLTAATNAANAGMTDTATSGRAISAVLNAYQLDAAQAENVSDVLFQTVKSGVVTFEQLANNLGSVLPVASALGVPITEVGAAYATLTQNGISAAESETALAAVMRSAQNPTEELTAAVQAQGYASVEQMIATEGLTGLLSLLQTESGGSAEAMNTLLGSSEATTAALALTANGSAMYTDFLKEMNLAMGDAKTTQEALAVQQATTGAAMARLAAAFQIIRIQIGTMFLPLINAATGALATLARAFLGMSDSSKRLAAIFASVTAGLLLVGGGALMAYPALLRARGLIGNFAKDVPKAAQAVRGFAMALRALAFNPVTLVIAAAALGAFLAYQHNIFGFGDAVRSVFGGIVGFIDRFREAWDRLGGGGGTSDVMNQINQIGGIASSAAAPINNLSRFLGALGDAIRGIGGGDVGFFNAIGDALDLAATAVQRFTVNFTSLNSTMGPVQALFGALAMTIASFGDGTGGIQAVADTIWNLGGALAAVGAAIGDLFSGDTEGMFENLGKAAQYGRQALDGMSRTASAAAGFFTRFGSIAGAAVTNLGRRFPAIARTLQGLGSTITGVFTTLGAASRAAAALFAGDWDAAREAVGQMFDSMLQTAVSFLGLLLGIVSDAAGLLRDALGAAFDWVAERAGAFAETIGRLEGIFDGVLGVVENVAAAFQDLISGDISGFFSNMGQAAMSAFEAIGSAALLVPQLIVDAFQAIPWGSLASGAAGFLSGLGSAAMDALQGLSDTVQMGLQLAWDAITSINWGDYVPDLDWGGIVGAIGDFGAWLLSNVPAIASFAWTGIIKPLGEFGAWLLGQVPAIASFAWTGIIQPLGNFGMWLLGQVPAIASFAWTGIIQPLGEFGAWILSNVPAIASFAWTGIIQPLGDFGAWLLSFVPGIASFAWSGLIQGLGNFGSWLKENVPAIASFAWSGIIQGLGNFGTWLKNNVPAIASFAWSGIIQGLGNFGTWLKSNVPAIASFAWSGIIQGLGSFGSWLRTNVSQILDFAWPGVTDIVGAIPWPEIPPISWPSPQDILDAIQASLTGGGTNQTVASVNQMRPTPGGTGFLEMGYGGDSGYASGTGTSALLSDLQGRQAPDPAPYQALTTAVNALVTALNTMGTALGTAQAGLAGLGVILSGAGTGFTNLNASVATSTAAFVSFVAQTIGVMGGWSVGIGVQVTTAMTTVSTGITTSMTSGTTAIVSFVASTIGVMGGWSSGISNQVTTAMTTVSTAVTTNATSAQSAIVSFVANTIGVMGGWSGGIQNIVRTASSTIKSELSSASSTGSNHVRTLASNTRSSANDIASAGRSAGDGFRNGISSGFSAATQAAAGAVQSIVGVMGSLVGALGNIGTNASNAFASGLRAGLGAARAAANELASIAASAASSRLAIASPSKVFVEIGRQVGAGFIHGIERMFNPLQSATEELATRAPVGFIGNAAATVGGNRPAPGTIYNNTSRAGATNVNYTILTIPPDDWIKVARQAENAPQLAVAELYRGYGSAKIRTH